MASTSFAREQQVAECYNESGLDMKIRAIYEEGENSPRQVQISLRKFSISEQPEFNLDIPIENFSATEMDGAILLKDESSGFKLEATIVKENEFMVSRDSSISLDKEHLEWFLNETINLRSPLSRHHSRTYCNYDMLELKALLGH